MGRQENVGADHAALSGVVAVFAVILAIQLFAGTIGGRSDSGLSCASFRLRDAQMQSCHWLSTLSPFLIFGIKKDRQLFAHCDQSTVSFSVFSFFKLAGGEQHFMLFADGRSTRDRRTSVARECSSLDGTK